jgi:hypothetical protein
VVTRLTMIIRTIARVGAAWAEFDSDCHGVPMSFLQITGCAQPLECVRTHGPWRGRRFGNACPRSRMTSSSELASEDGERDIHVAERSVTLAAACPVLAGSDARELPRMCPAARR